jgi:type II secretory pathway component PulC
VTRQARRHVRAWVGLVAALGLATPAAALEPPRLAATLVTADDAAALLEHGSTQAWLRPGQAFAGCRVASVRMHVVRLDCAGHERELRLQPGARGPVATRAVPAMDSVSLPPGALQALAAQPQAVALAMDVMPVAEQGALQGWQVRRLDQRSSLAGLGLKESDVVLAIDGASAAEPAAFAAALRALPAAGSFMLELLRDGEPLTLLVSAPPGRTP